MNYYYEHRLEELGITSKLEADELEYELEIRFAEFTRLDRETWVAQNAYLDYFARTGIVTSAARNADVTVYTAQRWKHDNVLGFRRRLEIAELEFKDGLQEQALARASEPGAPASLMIELLRAYVPEKFSSNGHKCDTSKSDEILRRFRENAWREKEAGHPKLMALARGATNAPPQPEYPPAGGPSETSAHDRHTGGGASPRTSAQGRHQETAPAGHPAHIPGIAQSPELQDDIAYFELSPTGETTSPNPTPAGARPPHPLSPPSNGGEIRRGGPSPAGEETRQGDSPTADEHAPPAKPPKKAIMGLFQRTRRPAGSHDPDTFKVVRF